ncbi:MAG: MarR family transcriptional regulator [Bacteroidota bacterium]|nr:MarR family transcriptional regulator [Bacteroidota bacterium]
MLDKRSKAKLEALMTTRKRNLAKHIYIMYRYFNEWANKKWLKDGWGEIRPDHLRLISIVGMEAVNNNELAKRARVSKQAMSKMVNDLVGRGFIEVYPDPNDSRANIISVSKDGVDFLGYMRDSCKSLEEHFSGMIGREKTTVLIDILSELTEGILECEKQEFENKTQKKGKG